MKRLLEIPEYQEDVASVAAMDLPWEKLRGKSLLITGGTGLIGSFLIDVLMAKDINVSVVLLGRNEVKARDRFAEYWHQACLHFVKWDVSASSAPVVADDIDYCLHLASNTHPVAYATDPIGTIATNVIALNNLLTLASEKKCDRFLFASSNEIYGENRGDVEFFDERYCGYIDCNTLRAGYPESKRCGEALCQAFIKQMGLDCVIARLTRSYGPTILSSDTKAISQFFNNALAGEDIVLKSDGRQYYSYQYVADSVSGLLAILLRGNVGEAYNVADESSDITLRDLAAMISRQAGRSVIFDLPSSVEASGFSRVTKARLSGAKVRSLGWTPLFDIQYGVARNMTILRKYMA